MAMATTGGSTAVSPMTAVTVGGHTETYPRWNPLAKELIRQTDWRIQLHNRLHHFVLLPAFDAAIDKIVQYGFVTIIGLPGDGKTELGIEILRHFHDYFKMEAVIIHKPSEWRTIVQTEQKCIILIDDIFGAEYFSEKQCDKWKACLDEIASFSRINRPNLQNIFIVITSRKNILLEGRARLHTNSRLFEENVSVDLTTEYKIDRSHKREIIYNYLQNKQEDLLPTKTIEKIVSVETPLGFPYICSLFFSRQEFFDRKQEFFESPNEVLIEHLNRLFKDSLENTLAFALVLLSCHDSKLDTTVLSRGRKHDMIEKICTELGFPQEVDVSMVVIEHLKQLTDVYLLYNRPINAFEFRHPSVRNAVFVTFCKLYPKLVLRACPIQDYDYIEDLEHSLIDSITFNMGESLRKQIMCERIQEEILDNPQEILNLNLMKSDTFVDHLFTYLAWNGLLQNILNWRMSSPTSETIVCPDTQNGIAFVDHCHSLIYFSYSNAAFMSRLFKHNIDKLHSIRWLKDELACTLRRASNSGHIDVIEVLFAHGAALYMSYGATFREDITRSLDFHTKVPISAQNRIYEEDLVLVRNLATEPDHLIKRSISNLHIDQGTMLRLEQLRKFQKWSSSKLETVMMSACKEGDIQVVKYLLKHSVPLPNDGLELAITSRDGGLELFNYLQTIGTWSEEQKLSAFNFACEIGSLQHVNILIEEVDPQRAHLLSSAGNAADSFHVFKVVYECRQWDQQQTEDAMCVASFKGNVEVLRYFANAIENNESNLSKFSDRCLVFACLSTKPVPVLSVLCHSQRDWSDKAVTDAMEIACAKYDMTLVECLVLNFKGHFGDRVLSIAATRSDDDDEIELLTYLMTEYDWSKHQKSTALYFATEQLNMSAVRYLMEHGAQFERCAVPSVQSTND